MNFECKLLQETEMTFHRSIWQMRKCEGFVTSQKDWDREVNKNRVNYCSVSSRQSPKWMKENTSFLQTHFSLLRCIFVIQRFCFTNAKTMCQVEKGVIELCHPLHKSVFTSVDSVSRFGQTSFCDADSFFPVNPQRGLKLWHTYMLDIPSKWAYIWLLLLQTSPITNKSVLNF